MLELTPTAAGAVDFSDCTFFQLVNSQMTTLQNRRTGADRRQPAIPSIGADENGTFSIGGHRRYRRRSAPDWRRSLISPISAWLAPISANQRRVGDFAMWPFAIKAQSILQCELDAIISLIDQLSH